MMGIAGPYTGEAIDTPPDPDDKCAKPNTVIGSYTLTAEPLAPLGYSNQPEIFGRASVEVTTAGLDSTEIDPKPCPDPCLNCGFTAIWLEHETSPDVWEKVGTHWDEMHEGKKVGEIWQIYGSPGAEAGSNVYLTQRATGDPPKPPDWDPHYQDGGWPAVQGRRYRTCVQLADAYEGDAETSGYECGPARLYPDEFPVYGPPPPFELAIDPLAWLLRAAPGLYVAINLPRPPTMDVLRAQVDEQIAAMTQVERRQARGRVEELRTYLDAIEQGLENS